MNPIPRLHDSTLEMFALNWKEGSAQITFSTSVNGAGVVVFKLTGVTQAVCPRHSPWGPSDSVNEVTLKRAEDGQLLSIEMQSGDVLEIRCTEVQVE